MIRDTWEFNGTVTVEDAFAFIVTTLQGGTCSNYGYDLYLHNVMDDYLQKVHHSPDYSRSHSVFPRISPPFYAAAWELCRRGIIRPGVRKADAQCTDEGSAGGGYSILPSGEKWLKESVGRFDFVPTEPNRFARMLARYDDRFGEGFHERSQEANRCYAGNTFLACCAMCGAAAESIMLVVAVALKKGDSAAVESAYLSGGGGGKVEKWITSGITPQLQDEWKRYTSLLNYWRDSAAHGRNSHIGENEAYTALLLLLRFAMFASDRWAELTQTN